MKKQRAFVAAACMFLAFLMGLTVFLGALGSTGALAASRAEIEELEQQRELIAAQKEELSARIATLEAEQATVMEKKAALDEQNELTRREIELIVKQIEMYDKLLALKEQEVGEAAANEEMQMERYRTRVRAMEENGAVSYISILFEAKSFADLLSRIDSIREIMEADKRLEEDYIAAREHVELVRADYEVAQADHELRKLELLEKKAKLEAEVEQAYRMLLALAAEIDEFSKDFEEIDAEEQRLDAEITEMLAEIQRQEEEAKRLAEQNGGAGPVIGTGTLIWPFPTNNYVSSGFGPRLHPILGYTRQHTGVDIGGASGAEIVAADGGTVIMATVNGGYGNCVIVSHGNGISTLYAHLNSIAVSNGQAVSKGQTVGYCGTTGLSTGPHLHYEVRINGVAVDPLGYYAAGTYVRGF